MAVLSVVIRRKQPHQARRNRGGIGSQYPFNLFGTKLLWPLFYFIYLLGGGGWIRKERNNRIFLYEDEAQGHFVPIGMA